MKPKMRLMIGAWTIAMLAGCASVPLGPTQYTPDEQKLKGYTRVGKAMKTKINEVEVTAEPLTESGLAKVLNPGEKAKEVGYTEDSQKRLSNSMVFYVTLDNQGKEQAIFTPTKTRLIYERKNWYKVNTNETIYPLDPADFYVILSKVKGAKERLDTISSNMFHGATIISPGQKKSGLIFFPWDVEEKEVLNFRLSVPGVFVGTDTVDYSFNFKIEPIKTAVPPRSSTGK